MENRKKARSGKGHFIDSNLSVKLMGILVSTENITFRHSNVLISERTSANTAFMIAQGYLEEMGVRRHFFDFHFPSDGSPTSLFSD